MERKEAFTTWCREGGEFLWEWALAKAETAKAHILGNTRQLCSNVLTTKAALYQKAYPQIIVCFFKEFAML